MHPSRKRLLRAYVGLGLFVVVLVAMVFWSVFQPVSPDALEVARILAEIDAEQAARADALAAARVMLPADAPIPRDWDFLEVQAECQRSHALPLIMIMNSYLDQDELSDRFERTRRHHYGRGPIDCGRGRFDGRIEIGDGSPEFLWSQLEEYILGLNVLDEIRYGLHHGLCSGLSAEIWDPKEARLVGLAYHFASRAAAEAARGETERALQFCIDGLRLADLYLEWPLTKGHERWAFARRVVMRGVGRVMDHAEFSQEQISRLDAAMNTDRAEARLLEVIRYHAAITEADREAGNYGMPRIAALAAGRTGQGSLKKGKELLGLLNSPPPRSNNALLAFREDANGHYWHDRFIRQATHSVWLTARESYSRDVFRLALRLKAHRLEHGIYPEGLNELLPPVVTPMDPASGESLVYERRGDGFRISAPATDAVNHAWFWAAQN